VVELRGQIEVSERVREVIERLIKGNVKAEVSEGGREAVERVVEAFSVHGETGERGREMVNCAGKSGSKSNNREGEREVIYFLVKFTSKSQRGNSGWQFVDLLVEIIVEK
jgi:hypothetical protein